MSSPAARIAWASAVALLFSWGIYTVLGSAVQATTDASLQHITVIDTIERGQHSFSGMVMVPTPCHAVSVRVDTSRAPQYTLLFETWQEPFRETCLRDLTPRNFHVVTYAPSLGVSFNASVDGSDVPLTVIPRY